MKSLHILLASLTLVGSSAPRTPSAAAGVPPPSDQTHGRQDCPFDRVAGQIEQVVGRADQVVLARGGRRLAIYPNRCILEGDRLKVGPDALVRVSTTQGVREFGESGEPVWAPERGEPGGSSSFFASIQTAFETLFGRNITRHEYAISRDLAVCRDDQYSGRPVAALSRLPETPQIFGADLPNVAVAWKFGGAATKISLATTNGALIAETQTCNATAALLPLPANRRHPGERLMLTIEDTQGGALHYPIQIVSPKQIDRPATQINGWLLGAWRMMGSNGALRLDALSRLARGADKSYAARRMLDAIADDETF